MFSWNNFIYVGTYVCRYISSCYRFSGFGLSKFTLLNVDTYILPKESKDIFSDSHNTIISITLSQFYFQTFLYGFITTEMLYEYNIYIFTNGYHYLYFTSVFLLFPQSSSLLFLYVFNIQTSHFQKQIVLLFSYSTDFFIMMQLQIL